MFFGYRIERWENKPILIAEPEKAILDTLYLNPHWRDAADIDGLRLNWPVLADIAQVTIIKEYAAFYGNQRVTDLSHYIIQQMTNA